MNSQGRRGRILEYLTQAHEPLSATWLAHALEVSRQIIVGDVPCCGPPAPISSPPPGATCWMHPPQARHTPWPAAMPPRIWSRS